MRKILTALMGTVSGVVLLFSYHTSVGPAATVGTAATGTSDTTRSTPDAGQGLTNPPATAASQTEAGSPTATVSGVFTGDAVQTPYGPVQVEIAVENGVLTSSQAVRYPNGDRHDQQINSYAVPVLNAEAVDSQSANIDSVSGATFTSLGYVQSLQSAIDQAFQ